MTSIQMHSAAVASELPLRKWEHAIVGVPVDDRGRKSRGLAEQWSAELYELKYDPGTLQLKFADVEDAAESLEHVIRSLSADSILLDTTTLGFAEVFLTCRAASVAGLSALSFLYAEPDSYLRPRKGRVLSRRDFELSVEVNDFAGLPGAAFMLRSGIRTKAVFLLGYEGQRLEQALEQTSLRPSDCSVVLGVPAFRPGWEMDSFANVVRVLQERQVSRAVLYGGAQNPQAAFECIDSVYQSLAPDERLLIAPIGTKPHGIGAALFATVHPDVALMYDFPKPRADRTDEVGVWHLFEVQLTSP